MGARVEELSVEHQGSIPTYNFAKLNIIVANIECVPTFQDRRLGLIVELAYLITLLIRGMAWRMNKYCTHNDY